MALNELELIWKTLFQRGTGPFLKGDSPGGGLDTML